MRKGELKRVRKAAAKERAQEEGGGHGGYQLRPRGLSPFSSSLLNSDGDGPEPTDPDDDVSIDGDERDKTNQLLCETRKISRKPRDDKNTR
jgi:hypothetical protein